MMDSKQSVTDDSVASSTSISNTAKKTPVEINERKSSDNSNSDSGYHSDLSGYHKGDGSLGEDYDSKLVVNNEKPADQQHNVEVSGDYKPANKSASRICSSSAAAHEHDCQSEIVSTSDSISAKHFNSYVTSNKGAIKSCSTCVHSNYDDSFESKHLTSPAVSSLNSDCTVSETADVYTTVASYLPMKSISSFHANDDLKTTVQDLALKIEFCVMFGYTLAQVIS